MSHTELSRLCASLQIQSGRRTIPTLVRNIWGALVRVQNVTSGVGQDGQLITVEDGEERRRLPFFWDAVAAYQTGGLGFRSREVAHATSFEHRVARVRKTERGQHSKVSPWHAPNVQLKYTRCRSERSCCKDAHSFCNGLPGPCCRT